MAGWCCATTGAVADTPARAASNKMLDRKGMNRRFHIGERPGDLSVNFFGTREMPPPIYGRENGEMFAGGAARCKSDWRRAARKRRQGFTIACAQRSTGADTLILFSAGYRAPWPC